MTATSYFFGDAVDGSAVTLDGEELFIVRRGIEGVTNAEERPITLARRSEQ